MSLPTRDHMNTIPCSATCSPVNVELPQSVVLTPAPQTGFTRVDRAGFRRVRVTEEPSPCTIPWLPQGVLEMRVKEGSKIRNLLGFATARMQDSGVDVGHLGIRQVVFTGSDKGVTKTITCAEILKRKLGGLHQLSKLYYKTVNEVWEDVGHSGPRVTVQKTVPAISILLSKDPMDHQEPGYQPPQPLNALFEDRERRESRMAVRGTSYSPCSQPNLHVAKRVCLEDSLPQTPFM